MDDIKDLIKRAKKEEKKNAEFLYELGMKFRFGEGTEQSEKKAAKYFEKAADLGHVDACIENAIRWANQYKSYYYANFYLQKAISQGSERAEKVLIELQETMDDRDNPAYLYREGMKHLSATPINVIKAMDCFYKSGEMGYEKAKLEYGRYYSERFYEDRAEKWLSELSDAGNEEAAALLTKLLEMKTTGGATTPSDFLYEKSARGDDAHTKFIKRHTLISCPACKGKIIEMSRNTVGKLKEKYITVYDEGSLWERKSDPYYKPTEEGQTETQCCECLSCKLAFRKTTHTRYEERENSSGKMDWYRLVKITYEVDKTKVDKNTLKVLKEFNGDFEEKYV